MIVWTGPPARFTTLVATERMVCLCCCPRWHHAGCAGTIAAGQAYAQVTVETTTPAFRACGTCATRLRAFLLAEDCGVTAGRTDG